MLTTRRIERGPRSATNSNLVFVEKTPREKGFAVHFEHHIKPKLLKIEEARLDALEASRKREFRAILGGVAVAVVAVSILLQLEAAVGVWFFFALAVLIGSVAQYKRPSPETRKSASRW